VIDLMRAAGEIHFHSPQLQLRERITFPARCSASISRRLRHLVRPPSTWPPMLALHRVAFAIAPSASAGYPAHGRCPGSGRECL
jgi:hypothetical protein